MLSIKSKEINRRHLAHFKEKGVFRQSLDEKARVKISLNKKNKDRPCRGGSRIFEKGEHGNSGRLIRLSINV